MLPLGVEPRFPVPETGALSIELQERDWDRCVPDHGQGGLGGQLLLRGLDVTRKVENGVKGTASSHYFQKS